MEKRVFDFNEFMGLITFMLEDNYTKSLIEDMRIILEKKIGEGELNESKLDIFDWYISNYKTLNR